MLKLDEDLINIARLLLDINAFNRGDIFVGISMHNVGVYIAIDAADIVP